MTEEELKELEHRIPFYPISDEMQGRLLVLITEVRRYKRGADFMRACLMDIQAVLRKHDPKSEVPNAIERCLDLADDFRG